MKQAEQIKEFLKQINRKRNKKESFSKTKPQKPINAGFVGKCTCHIGMLGPTTCKLHQNFLKSHVPFQKSN